MLLAPIPAGLQQQRELGADWADWLDRLPRLTAEVAREWDLAFGDELWHGFCSLVAPVTTAEGEPAALKLTFDGDDESLHESLALQRWQGDGAARLLRADPARRVLLLERLQTRDLAGEWDLAACEMVAGLYGRLHVPALPQLRTVSSYVAVWLAELSELPREAPLPRRYVEQALSLGRDLLADPDADAVLVHGDLHYDNVLHSERGWLAIDPKPMAGDAHYEIAPMLWNRLDELAGDLRSGIRRRFHALVDGAGLDEARARDWVVVRMVLNAHWTLQDAAARPRPGLTSQDRDHLTSCVAVVKAVQD